MLLHQLISIAKNKTPNAIAITHQDKKWSYQHLDQLVQQQASAFLALKLKPQQRVAIYLPKQIETVTSFFAICQSGGVFVPINPVLKAAQVSHILKDCNVQILITSSSRLQTLKEILVDCPDLKTIIFTDNEPSKIKPLFDKEVLNWQTFLTHTDKQCFPDQIDSNMAAILYTSGSTGNPKGVVLSHRNLITGAQSVSQYLNIQKQDKLLAVLPFSFDYGLNQLISAFFKGACCVLLDYLLPRDVIKALEKNQITGLAAVPSLWAQLANLKWPNTINQHLRFMTNSGGKMPKHILDNILNKSQNSQFYLMYGLTEAFRSTYLPPEQISSRPDSIGKAIPNAEVLVVRKDGSLCEPYEAGELVHKGSLVAMGYWNAPEKTAERFKPAPNQLPQLPLTEIAVWSGDQVKMDNEGYLYFIERQDEMLKTSGYRVSPTEIENVIHESGLVKEVAAIGIPHETLGQSIFAIISTDKKDSFDSLQLIQFCKSKLANFMIPAKIIVLSDLPKNPNGKIDKNKLRSQFSNSIS